MKDADLTVCSFSPGTAWSHTLIKKNRLHFSDKSTFRRFSIALYRSIEVIVGVIAQRTAAKN
jgi:hypothetical protein